MSQKCFIDNYCCYVIIARVTAVYFNVVAIYLLERDRKC